MPLTESDKVTLTQYPALPSKCAVCNFASDGKRNFVDFQLSFDFDGSVNICVECMNTIASLLGFVTPSVAEGLRADIENLEIQNADLIQKVSQYDSTINTLLVLRPDLVNSDLPALEGDDSIATTDDSQLTFDIG